jgi:hypothetical protein
MANRIQLRRGGSQEWRNANPTLAQGEVGIDLDSGRIKIGDGSTAWNSLAYERPVESVANTANSLVQRDADGNFQAGTITGTVIGNASTASRLANVRQIQLTQDIVASGTFDGSQNLNLAAELQEIPTLPHFGADPAQGTYTSVTVDAKGRIINASNPSTIQDYNLDGVVEGQSAQPYDNDLSAVSSLTGTGISIRIGDGNWITRSILSTAGQVVVSNGSGTAGNPQIDLATTTVVDGDYNTESLTSVIANGPAGEPFGTETVNAVKFTVDDRGRLQSATNVPIATATEGSKYANYDAATAYSRYAIIQNASKVYQAYESISAGAGAPAHSSGDTGGWRYLAAEATEQKGLASFAQEDFDVDSNGHVTIAALGVDNLQLQNNRVSFADGNTKEDFELDQELTATTGYRGFNYLNYIKVNDTSGGLLFGANNTGDSGAGELDVNVRSYFSDPNIDLDGAVDQIVSKYGDGHWTVSHVQNTGTPRNLNILATNSGAGSANIVITSDDTVQISASDAAGKVWVEDYRFQENYIATTNATLNIDPGDDRAVTGTVRVWGDLQVDGTTTTVNSTTLQVDDPIITLGGDTDPVADDNLDRGIEFRYYDSQARRGFFGYDDSYTDLGGHSGGYAFYYNATNTAEVFSGTDAGVLAGNLKLTTSTNSTTNTTGDLVIAGGAGIGQDVNVGGSVDIDTNLTVHGTTLHDDNIVIQGASKVLQLNNGTGTNRIELQSTTGNASFYGVVDITNNLNINTNKFNIIAATGNTAIAGTVNIEGVTTITDACDFNSTLNVAADVHFEATNEPTFALNGSTGVWEIQSNDYGSFRFDGGGYIAGDFMFDSDVVINGTILQKESSTEVFNEQNFLRVRRKLQVGTTVQFTPNYATHGTSNARIVGGAGIGTSLHIGGTSAGEGLFVGKKNNGDTVKFSVLGASGDTDIQGTLNVEGASVIDDTLNVTGAVDLDSTLNVDNDATFQSNVTINGDNLLFTIESQSGTDAFTVDSDNGNTIIAGTLDVDDATQITNTLNVTNGVDFDQTLNVDGAVDFNSTLVVDGQTTIYNSVYLNASNEEFAIQNGSGVDKFTVDSDNGNTIISGTVDISGATGITNTLTTSGVNTFTNSTQQTLTGSYGADGALRLTGGAGIGKNLAVSGDTRVYGATELTGALDLNNSADISGIVTITNTSDITSYGDASVSLTTAGGLRVNKNAYIGGDFYVYDNSNTRAAFSVDNSTGNGEFHNNLIVGGDLTVNGTTTTVNSTVVTIDDPVFTLGGDTAPGSDDNKDRGIEFRYHTGSTAALGFFGYDDSASEFVFLTASTNSSEVFTGTDGNLRANQLHLTGSGTTLDVDADAIINGDLTVDDQIISTVTGKPPLVVASNSKVNNLNADLLDGLTTSSTDTTGASVVSRSNGNFSANQITVNSGIGALAGIQGNATTADELRTARTVTIDGVVNATVSFDGSQNVTLTTTFDDADMDGLAAMAGTGFVSRTAANTYAQRTLITSPASGSGITVTQGDGVAGDPTINILSASTNAANNLVLRDGSGSFASNEITMVTSTVSANATIGGTLGVTGITSLTDLLNADGGIAVDGTNFTVNGTTGAVSTASTLNADAAVTFGSTLGVTSNATIGGTLGVTGTVTASANLDVTVDATVGGTLGVTGITTLSNNLTVTGTSAFTGAITATGGVVGNVTGQTSDISNHDTDALTEGSTNIYYTNERVDDRVAALISGGTGITATYNDAGNLLTLSATQADISTDLITEGSTNLFTTAARTRTHFTYGNGIELNAGELSVTEVDIDTDNVTEGSTNLFTTAARTRTHFTYGTGIEHDGSGALSVTQADIDTDNVTEGSTNIFYTEARFDASLAGKNTADLTEGTNLYYTDARADARIANADTDALSEGSTNLYFTDARADARIAAASTTDLTEGTNLYYTDARADARIAAADTDALSEGSTNLYYTDARADARITAADTDALSEGATNLYYTDARADARVALATGTNLDLTNQSTTDLAEGTNQYYTEARVQAKLDNAFAQLQAMLTNLATTTTLTLDLSGDPTPGAVVATGSINTSGLGGFTAGTAIATTSDGVGTGLTVDTTVDASGAITAVAANAGGTDYLIGETITLTNPNLGGASTFDFGSLVAGTNYTTGTGLTTTGGDSTGLTVDIAATGGSVTGVTVNAASSGYTIGNTITIVNPAATGLLTVDTIGAADALRTAGTYVIEGSDYSDTGSGTGAEFSVVVDGSGAATVTVTTAGSGYAVDDTITVNDANLGGGGAANLTFDVATIITSDATIDLSTVFTNATFALSDITTMEVGATVTGATSGTTGVITALAASAITVDTVDGFFKVGEVVSANDVTTLTVNSFS